MGTAADAVRPKRVWASPGLWLGVGLSLGCLWLAFRRVPFAELASSLTRAEYLWLVPAVLFHLLAVLARAGRWQSLLAARGIFGSAFWSQGIGFLFTNLFPLRLGEPARVLALAGMARLPVLKVTGSAIVERLLDVATILAFLGLSLPWMDMPASILRTAGALTWIVILACVGLMVLLRYPAQTGRWLTATLKRLGLPAESVAARWAEIVDSVTPLADPRRALIVLVWSVGVWGLYTGFYLCVLRAFEPAAAPVEAAFMVVALALAITIPSSPGFIGVYQLAGQQALVLPFGGKYDLITALAVTLVSHVVYYLLTSVLGAIGLWRLGDSVGDLWRRLRRRGQLEARGREAEHPIPGDER